jgi:hypothetical protein
MLSVGTAAVAIMIVSIVLMMRGFVRVTPGAMLVIGMIPPARSAHFRLPVRAPRMKGFVVSHRASCARWRRGRRCDLKLGAGSVGEHFRSYYPKSANFDAVRM